MRSRTAWAIALLVSLLGVSGCATNPVTGVQELSLVSTSMEVSTGEEYFLPMQQVGGGLYTVDPALTEYVTGVGRKVAAVSERPLPYEFVVLNNSSPNAWALPGGKIAITRGLLAELDNEAELAAVLGHEVVHAAARHGAKSMQRGVLGQLVMLGATVALKDSDYANYILGAGSIGLQLVNQTYSRDAEREADYYGMKYMHAAGYDTGAAVTLQEKFVALAKHGEANWLEGLFASHPASTERVENNRAALAKFAEGGDLGRSAYEERVADLRAHKAAYEEADRARKILRQNPETALKAIDRAIVQEPREPLFYGIKGQALAYQGHYGEAVSAYDAAIERDTGYYGHYLGRGLAHEKLGQRARARSDLERSNSLLPTAAASYSLGGIALADGDRAEAKRLFKAASQVREGIGRQAREAYIKLDLADAPGRYIAAEAFLGRGEVMVKVQNTTRNELRDIVVRIDATINGQKLLPRIRPIARLQANAFKIVRTGMRYRDKDTVGIKAHVVQAAPAS